MNSLGWNVVPFDANCPLVELSNCAIEEYETESGLADYVLGVDGRIVVEAFETQSPIRMCPRKIPICCPI